MAQYVYSPWPGTSLTVFEITQSGEVEGRPACILNSPSTSGTADYPQITQQSVQLTVERDYFSRVGHSVDQHTRYIEQLEPWTKEMETCLENLAMGIQHAGKGDD